MFLVKNYRSHPDLLKLSNIFYGLTFFLNVSTSLTFKSVSQFPLSAV